MKNKYYVTYRCPMCNKMFTAPNSKPIELDYNEVSDLIHKIVSLQSFAHNEYFKDMVPPINVIHKCNDNNIGFASFCGLLDSKNGID